MTAFFSHCNFADADAAVNVYADALWMQVRIFDTSLILVKMVGRSGTLIHWDYND